MPLTQIASLETVKNFLRIPNPTLPNADDTTIQILMNAAQAAIENEVGHIVPYQVTGERHDGGKAELYLRELPVLSVTAVQEGWGYWDWDLSDQQVNALPALSIWSYSLDNAEQGILTRRSAGSVLVPFVSGRNNIRVVYTAGRSVLPPNAELAFCTLVSFWYRSTQLRLASPTGQEGVVFNALNEDFTKSTGDTSVNLGVPAAIIEMLKSDRRRPVIG